MLYRFLAVLSFLILGAIQALAADCIIVGGESSYRIPDCIENSPTTAVQKFLGSNYAIITDRKDGKILAIFLAENGEYNQDQIAGNIESASAEDSDSLTPIQSPEERRRIDFPSQISLSEADRALADLKSQAEIPTQFVIAFGDYHVMYDLNDADTIARAFEREKANLLNILDRQEQMLMEQPQEHSEKVLQMVEQGRNALMNNDVGLESVLVLK